MNPAAKRHQSLILIKGTDLSIFNFYGVNGCDCYIILDRHPFKSERRIILKIPLDYLD